MTLIPQNNLDAILPQDPEKAKAIDDSGMDIAQHTQQIVEAKGWIIGTDGEIILTTSATLRANADIPWLIPHSCQ